VLDDALVGDWCLSHLGAAVERVLFRSGYLSDVVGVELTNGQRAVVKARPHQARLAGCLQVQAALAEQGFACPKPLTGATRVHGLTVSAETELSGGAPLPAEAGPAPAAALLARLMASAPDPQTVPDLSPSPPWAGWDHPGSRLWPDLDEHGQDLDLVAAPDWVDAAARRVRERLLSTPARRCIGHGDWESQNLRWTGPDPLVVHDWDSVVAQPEPAIVGLAAAMWPSADDTATVAGSHEFITAYQEHARREWDPWEVRLAWAAGLWVRLLYVKQEAAEGATHQLDRLTAEIGERLDLAALT
jgi:hypothetical protein